MATTLDRRLETAAAPLFAPLGIRLPLRIEQTEWDDFVADAALASFTLRSAQSVLEADAIAAAFDTTAGVEPNADTFALTRRLVEEMGEGTAVLGTLPAPSTLVERLPASDAGALDAASGLATGTVDGLCAAGVAALVLLEESDAPDPGLFSHFDAAFNLAQYYQVPVLYLARHALAPGVAEAARAAGARWAVGPGDADGGVASVPLHLFSDDGAAAFAWAAGLPAGVRLYASSWELPADTPVEAVAAVRRALCT